MSTGSSKIFISVIIPSFNSASTISKSIEGILNQTYSNYEIIIMDGGSVDATLSEIDKFKSHSNIKVFSEKDDGIYDAINKGIRHSVGEWIYILGSDDRLFNNKVFHHLHSRSVLSKAAVVYGNVCIDGNAGWAQDGTIYDGKFDLKKILSKNICQQSVFYKRFLFNKYGNFEIRYKTCADWDFMLRIFHLEKIEFIDLTIAWFSGGGTSVSRSDDAFQNDLPFNLYRYFGKHLKNPVFYPFRYRFLDLSGFFYKSGNRWKAFKCKQIFTWLENHPPINEEIK